MKIPDNRKPYEVTINGVKKVYEAGATVADDPAVQNVIAAGERFPKAPPAPESSFNPPAVVANPALDGTEAALEGLQIGDGKYAVKGDEPFVVTYSSGSADKTLKEIGDAILAKKSVYGVMSDVVYPATGWTFSGGSLMTVQFAEQQYADMMGTTILTVTGFGYNGFAWAGINVSVTLGS